jgi:hypothetical protein
MVGDEKFSLVVQKVLERYGNKWNAAKTQDEKDKIHEMADQVRSAAMAPSKTGSSGLPQIVMPYGAASAPYNDPTIGTPGNCYTFALQLSEASMNNAIHPGVYAGNFIGTSKPLDLVDMYNNVRLDMQALGRGFTLLDSFDSQIKSNEYRVAMRVTSQLKNGIYDYHFMVQCSDGSWSEKTDFMGQVVNHPDYKYSGVSNILWERKEYNSNTIYFAVTIPRR